MPPPLDPIPNGLLGISLAATLPRNPSAVLRVIEMRDQDGVIGIDRVCGIPFIETTPSFNNAYVRRTLNALAQVHDRALASTRNACAARLRR